MAVLFHFGHFASSYLALSYERTNSFAKPKKNLRGGKTARRHRCVLTFESRLLGKKETNWIPLKLHRQVEPGVEVATSQREGEGATANVIFVSPSPLLLLSCVP